MPWDLPLSLAIVTVDNGMILGGGHGSHMTSPRSHQFAIGSPFVYAPSNCSSREGDFGNSVGLHCSFVARAVRCNTTPRRTVSADRTERSISAVKVSAVNIMPGTAQSPATLPGQCKLHRAFPQSAAAFTRSQRPTRRTGTVPCRVRSVQPSTLRSAGIVYTCAETSASAL